MARPTKTAALEEDVKFANVCVVTIDWTSQGIDNINVWPFNPQDYLRFHFIHKPNTQPIDSAANLPIDQTR